MAAVAERSMWVDDEGDTVVVTYVGLVSDKVYYRYTDLGGLSAGGFWMTVSNFRKHFKPKEETVRRGWEL